MPGRRVLFERDFSAIGVKFNDGSLKGGSLGGAGPNLQPHNLTLTYEHGACEKSSLCLMLHHRGTELLPLQFAVLTNSE